MRILEYPIVAALLLAVLCTTATAQRREEKQEATTTTLLADANGDGVTDGLDQLIWAANNGTAVAEGTVSDGESAATVGDFNGDDVVDGLDYLIWAAEYGGAANPDTDPDAEPDTLPTPLPLASRLEGWDLATAGVPLPRDEAELVATLSMLPALPKTHWSWGWSKANLRNTPRAHQTARISGSVGLAIAYADRERVDLAVAICEATGAKLSVHYSPWHHDYEQAHGGDVMHWDAAFTAELSLMQQKAAALVALLGEHIALVAICELDQETLRADLRADGKADPLGGKRADQAAAMQVKNDLAYDVFKSAFPDAEIVWHGFGGIHAAHHVVTQKHDGWAVTELYQNQGGPTLYRHMVTDFVRDAEAMGLSKFMPATSLGGFYDISVAAPHPGYVRDRPYPTRNSWRKGRDTNHPYFASERFEQRYGPTWKLGQLFWWPAPFAEDHEGYAEHFIAYVAGAANIKNSEAGWLDTLEK